MFFKNEKINKNLKVFLVLISLFLLIFSAVKFSFSQESRIQENIIELDYKIIENNNNNFISCFGMFELDKETTKQLYLDSFIPEDVISVAVEVNENRFTFTSSDPHFLHKLTIYDLIKQQNISLNDHNKIKITFVSYILLNDNNEFFNMLSFNCNLDKLIVKLTLPSGAVLNSNNNFGVPVFPTPTTYETNGMEITAVWVYEPFKPDENAYYISYDKQNNFSWYWVAWVILFIILIIILIAIVLFIVKISSKKSKKSKNPRKLKSKLSLKKSTKKYKKQFIYKNNKPNNKLVNKEELIKSHLKDEEEQIYNILKQRNGVCEQGTLVIISDFSKAKLSRILKEMEERKIIKKVKKGKKNLVYLKEDF